jgi:hypothetical protein
MELTMEWDVFWAIMLVMFVWIPLLMIWGFAIVDLFTRADLGGFAKVLWLLFIIFIPIIGTVAYYLFRPVVPQTTDRLSTRTG